MRATWREGRISYYPGISSQTGDSVTFSRREWLQLAALAAAESLVPFELSAAVRKDPDRERLLSWTAVLRSEQLSGPERTLGRSAIRAGELARGTPYQAATLEAYIRAGGSPRAEPLTLSLTRFDCVTLVEGCLAVARVAATTETPTWRRFGHEVERMRYRQGERRGYGSRLHYFSEWISDGAERGLVKDLGPELGAVEDTRPLRFMTEHRGSYPALADQQVYREIQAMERSLDGRPRRIVPAKCLPGVVDLIQSGDVLGFATEIQGLDATHAAFAHRGEDGVLRVLHAPLSGGVVQISHTTLPEYVAAIHHATGILVARPLQRPTSPS
ncbi:MAG TPA: N-acetylmuramoyl-L-alanine amidase-like domain-containing protein [Gemmatimonadales bacterium]